MRTKYTTFSRVLYSNLRFHTTNHFLKTHLQFSKPHNMIVSSRFFSDIPKIETGKNEIEATVSNKQIPAANHEQNSGTKPNHDEKSQSGTDGLFNKAIQFQDVIAADQKSSVDTYTSGHELDNSAESAHENEPHLEIKNSEVRSTKVVKPEAVIDERQNPEGQDPLGHNNTPPNNDNPVLQFFNGWNIIIGAISATVYFVYFIYDKNKAQKEEDYKNKSKQIIDVAAKINPFYLKHKNENNKHIEIATNICKPQDDIHEIFKHINNGVAGNHLEYLQSYLYVQHCVANEKMFNKKGVEAKECLELIKTSIERYAEYQKKDVDQIDRALNILYSKTLYSLGRTYFYKSGITRNEAIGFFDVTHKKSTPNMQEHAFSEIHGKFILQREEIEEDMKNGKGVNEKDLLKIIEGYKDYLTEDKGYLSDYNHKGESTNKLIFSEDISICLRCCDQIARCNLDLIKISKGNIKYYRDSIKWLTKSIFKDEKTKENLWIKNLFKGNEIKEEIKKEEESCKVVKAADGSIETIEIINPKIRTIQTSLQTLENILLEIEGASLKAELKEELKKAAQKWLCSMDQLQLNDAKHEEIKELNGEVMKIKDKLRDTMPPHGTLISSTKQDGGFWREYYPEAVDMLLPMRVGFADVRVSKSVTITEKYPVGQYEKLATSVLDKGYMLTNKIANELSTLIINILDNACHKSLIPIVYKPVFGLPHWIGLAFEKTDDDLQITYIDPENNPMPVALAQELSEAIAIVENINYNSDNVANIGAKAISFEHSNIISIRVVQQTVEEQVYSNNCGPELIEHFAQIITGHRVPQDKVTALHSRLLEKSLMGYTTDSIVSTSPVLSLEFCTDTDLILSINTAVAMENTLITSSEFEQETLVSFANIHSGATVSFTVFNYLNAIANMESVSGVLKSFLYRQEIAELKSVLKKYNIETSIDDVLTKKGFKTLALKLHPDKGGDVTDFMLAKDLRDKFEEDINVKSLVDEQMQTWLPKLYKVATSFKVVDTAIDSVRLYQIPTFGHAKQVTLDSLHTYSMYSGFTKVSIAANILSTSYTYYEHGLYSALEQGLFSTAFMLLPTMVAGKSPYLGFLYTTAMIGYSGYNVINNAYSLFQDNFGFDDVNRSAQELKSYTAHLNVVKWLAETTNINFFTKKAHEYTVKISALQGSITQEEALKVKHITITSSNQSYEHCIEIRNIGDNITSSSNSHSKSKGSADDNSNTNTEHYYCYNDEKKILDHILISGDNYFEVVEHL